MAPQEFAPAETFYEPVQDTLVLGLPPLLLVFGLLLLLGAGILGWWLGRRPVKAPGSAANSIWKAIDEAIRNAMTAHSDGLVERARELRRVIDNRLGKTLALTASFAPLKALDDALAGPSTHGHDHGHDHARGHGADDHTTAAHDDAHAEPTETHTAHGVVIEKASQVVIHQPPPRPTRPTPPPAPPPPAPPTEAQRRDAVRKAVSDLNDHWRLKDARVAEIEAAHTELSAPR